MMIDGLRVIFRKMDFTVLSCVCLELHRRLVELIPMKLNYDLHIVIKNYKADERKSFFVAKKIRIINTKLGLK